MTKSKKSLSVILSLMLLVSSLFCFRLQAFSASYKTVQGRFNDTYASQVLTLVNEQRSAYGLKALTMTASLTDGAMLRAAETAVSFSHTRPNGEQCFTAFEWTKAAGENIAYGQRTPEQVMNGWMNSSGHRANILSSNFTTIGIGCFEYNGTLYWAQAFSGGSGTSYRPSGTRSVTVDVSLTAGVESVVKLAESTTRQSTAPAPSTVAPSVTQPKTTAPNTTGPKTTALRTTVPRTTTPKTTAPKTTAPSTTKGTTSGTSSPSQQPTEEGTTAVSPSVPETTAPEDASTTQSKTTQPRNNAGGTENGKNTNGNKVSLLQRIIQFLKSLMTK
ncbi:MAG: hypothetical protein IJ168_05315 [Eubacterium sp.]|nr:hypothetical protein [Eubacterium sp.]